MTDTTQAISPTSPPAGDRVRPPSSARGDRPHRVGVLGLREPVSVPGGRDQRIAAIAKLQRGRISRRQLIDLGLTDATVHRMVTAGRLHRRCRGVYAVGHVAPIELERETVALLACPDGAVLSHVSAASVWGLKADADPGEPIHVTIPTDTRVGLAGLRSHRTRVLDAADVRMHRGLPITSPARTLIDIAGLVTHSALEHALDDALNHRLVREDQIRDVLQRARQGRRGAARLRALLDDRDRGGSSRSNPERSLRSLLAAAQLAQPRMNVEVLGYTVDYVWPELRVIVECDSWEFHSGRATFESDRRRDQFLEAHGWTVIRITARQLEREPYAVIARLAAALALAQARLTAAA